MSPCASRGFPPPTRAREESQVEHPKVVSPADWLAARQELLAKEKEFSRQRDALSAARRRVPWVRVEKPYTFAGPHGSETLADLFAGRGQLAIYHFMLGPGWEQGCPSCSFIADHMDGSTVHLAQRDVALAVVSRAPTTTSISSPRAATRPA